LVALKDANHSKEQFENRSGVLLQPFLRLY
jgi:hypothetical protein